VGSSPRAPVAHDCERDVPPAETEGCWSVLCGPVPLPSSYVTISTAFGSLVKAGELRNPRHLPLLRLLARTDIGICARCRWSANVPTGPASTEENGTSADPWVYQSQ
jgi:hypothetical protein